MASRPCARVAGYEAVAGLIEAAEEIIRSAADRPSSIESEDDNRPGRPDNETQPFGSVAQVRTLTRTTKQSGGSLRR